MTEQSESRVALFRQAWRETLGDTFADRMARQSLEASAAQDPDLVRELRSLQMRDRTELDLHLDGVRVHEHETDAASFADFVKGIADAVKEISKAARGRERLAANLRIVAPVPGSFRVVLRTLPSPTEHGHEVLTEAENADAQSLRQVAHILARAETDNDDAVVGGFVQALPPRARPAIARAAKAITREAWKIEGELRHTSDDPVPLHLTSHGAAVIARIIAERHVDTERVTLTGYVDGQRRSVGAMWFVPRNAQPIEAAIVDDELFDAVARLSTAPTTVQAVFTRRRTVAEAGAIRERSRYTLEQIVLDDGQPAAPNPGLLA